MKIRLLVVVFALTTLLIPADARAQRNTRAARESLDLSPVTIYGIESFANKLVSFKTDTPNVFQTDIPLTGVGASEAVVGMDFRPSTQQLYAVLTSSTGSRLAMIDLNSGAVTTVGTGFTPILQLPIAGQYGVAFDPVADVVRVIGTNDMNLRISPITGALIAVDAPVAYSTPLPNPAVAQIAYTNSVAGALSSTAYGIEGQSLVRIGGIAGEPSANSGELTVVGPLALQRPLEGGYGGFDIDNRSGVDTAWAVMSRTNNGEFFVSVLYGIDLSTGQATEMGLVGPTGFRLLYAMAVAPPQATAAGVDVSGRVLGRDGRGLTNAVVNMLGPDGSLRTVRTARRGRFFFENVEAGKTYTLSVAARRYAYDPQTISVLDNVSAIEFLPSRL